MEEFRETIPEIPPVQSEEVLSQEPEATPDQTDKIKHTSEQSSANISSGLSSTRDDSQTIPAVDDLTPINNSSAQGPTKITVTDQPVIALGGDRIEKVWINKAKAIIEDSMGDPHKKSSNLSIEKTEYKAALRSNNLISNH